MTPTTRRRIRQDRWQRLQRPRTGDRILLIVTMTFFVLLALLGGGIVNWTSAYMLLVVATIATTGFAAWRDSFTTLARIPAPGRAAVIGIAILPLLQFVPLPPAVWQALPGQSLRIATLDLVGAANTWQPLTLDPVATGLSAILAVGFVVLLSLLMQIDDSGFETMIDAAIGVVAFGILLGILQVVSDGQFPRLHPIQMGSVMLGVYANKNHMGLVIACAMVAFGLVAARRFDPRARQWIVAAASGFALICILTTNSRAGLAFGVLGAIVLFAGVIRRLRWQYWAAGAAVLVAAVIFVISSTAFDTVSARFSDVDSDLRWKIASWSLPLAGRYWLSGSGAGSYVAVFNPAEQLTWVKATYVNAAHNDYLQTVIELGVAGLVIVVLLAVSILRCLPALRGGAPGNAARHQALFGMVVIVMFALHSTVDYPLRRPAAWVFFALALAALYRSRASDTQSVLMKDEPTC